MKTAFSILVLLLLTFSGITFAQEAESSPASESTTGDSSPASMSENESNSESTEATPTSNPSETMAAESKEAVEEAPADTPSEVVAVTTEEVVIEETTIEDAVIQEGVIDVSEPVPGINTVPAEFIGPVVDFPSDKEGVPIDDVTITTITPVGPVTDASDDEIVVTPGPTVNPCVPSGPCGGDRPPHVDVVQGPSVGKPCALNNSENCNPDTPDDDTPDTPGGTDDSSSNTNSGSGGNDDDFLFHPAWNPFTGSGAVVAPPADVTQLVTPAPETTSTLSEEGPDPAIVALADGRPKPPVLVVNETPAPSPATGLFTGANASLIGTGILVLLGAFIIFRSRKN